jgi:putative phage-type endonuclease
MPRSNGTAPEPDTAGTSGDWRPWGIGGSDIGAVLGLCAYRSAVDVWLEKTRAGSAAEPKTALPMRLDSYLEPFVVQEYEVRTGYTAHAKGEALQHPQYPEIFGHVDRIVRAGTAAPHDIVLECKTCSAYRSSAYRSSEWGPAWSDQVPAPYLAQCLWYLGLAQCAEAHFAVLIGNTDFRVYRIKRDRELERHMFERAHSFWVDHVLAEEPPTASTRSDLESLHPRPAPGSAREASTLALWAIERKSQLEGALGLITEEIEGLKDSIAKAIGSAERLTWQGRTVASWRLGRGSARLDTERLRRECPDIVERYTVQGAASRRLLTNSKALGQPQGEQSQ